MKQVSGKELCRIVERHGWVPMRITGSHHIYSKTGIAVRLAIPVHKNKPLKIGLLRYLLKQAGLNEDDV